MDIRPEGVITAKVNCEILISTHSQRAGFFVCRKFIVKKRERWSLLILLFSTSKPVFVGN